MSDETTERGERRDGRANAERAGKNPRRRLFWLASIAVVVAVVGTAAAASLLFSQSVPGGTAPAAGASPGCATLVVDTTATAASSGDAENVYGCGTNGAAAAFSVTTAGSYTPTFTRGGGFTSSFLVSAGASVPTLIGCANMTGAVAITSATPSSLSIGGYDYCFDSAQGATLVGFTVDWT